jgi:N-acetylglutamate synthase-like GNAT family acetyltransferase
MKIIVRPFIKPDQDQVIALISHIQQNEFNIPITPEEQPDLKDIDNFYQTKNGNFWVALHEEAVVGAIALLDIGHKQAALRKMFVKAEYRGKEIGTAGMLLETLLDWAENRNLREIYLGTTPKFLAAHRFYEKNNFILVPKENLPPAFPVMTVDTRFYKYMIQDAPS